MSEVRSRSRLIVTRPSARARWAPAQWWMPCPKATWYLAFVAVEVELVRVLEQRAGRGWRRRAGASSCCRPGSSTPADRRAHLGHAELGPQRALVAQRLLDEVRDAVAVARAGASWRSGRSARIRSANDSSRTVVSWPPANRLAASSATSFTSGVVPSGKVAVAIAVMMSSRGLAAAVLDVGGELLVEELERLVLQLLGQLGEPLGEQRVVGLGHAFEVGDHQQGERRGVVA